MLQKPGLIYLPKSLSGYAAAWSCKDRHHTLVVPVVVLVKDRLGCR